MHKYKAKKTVACKKCGADMNNNPCKCNMGFITFASKKEAKYFQELLLRKKAGEVKDIELQPRYLLQEGFNKNGQRYRPIHYVADFLITYSNGKIEVVDCKGKKTQVYGLKKKLFEYRYNESIREV